MGVGVTGFATPLTLEEREAVSHCSGLQNWDRNLGLLTPRPQLSCHGKLRCCSNEGLDKTGVYKTLGFPLLLLEVPIKCSLQQGHIRTKNVHLRPGGQ